MKRSCRGGLSLVELSVGLLVGFLCMFILHEMKVTGNRLFSRSEQRMESVQSASILMNVINQDLANAVPDQGTDDFSSLRVDPQGAFIEPNVNLVDRPLRFRVQKLRGDTPVLEEVEYSMTSYRASARMPLYTVVRSAGPVGGAKEAHTLKGVVVHGVQLGFSVTLPGGTAEGSPNPDGERIYFARTIIICPSGRPQKDGEESVNGGAEHLDYYPLVSVTCLDGLTERHSKGRLGPNWVPVPPPEP